MFSIEPSGHWRPWMTWKGHFSYLKISKSTKFVDLYKICLVKDVKYAVYFIYCICRIFNHYRVINSYVSLTSSYQHSDETISVSCIISEILAFISELAATCPKTTLKCNKALFGIRRTLLLVIMVIFALHTAPSHVNNPHAYIRICMCTLILLSTLHVDYVDNCFNQWCINSVVRSSASYLVGKKGQATMNDASGLH